VSSTTRRPKLWNAATLAVLLLFSILIYPCTAQQPPRRLMPCPTTDAQLVTRWQRESRTVLRALLVIDDLEIARPTVGSEVTAWMPLNVQVLETQDHDSFCRRDVQIDSRPDRQIKVVLTIPTNAQQGKTPAVICIHGHGGNRNVVYDEGSIYRGFAAKLAESGYVTLSTDVGQHALQDEQRTLMGERLWDLMRLVDLAERQPEVDPRRIGCGGLSLGGEMAMWLGALDTRIAATVSSGFLTTMENMRVGHCMCWDFPGLQRRFEFSDIYSLIAPRPLQCQNGQLESLPGGFPVALAEKAMGEIKHSYRALGTDDHAQLRIHDEGHVLDLPAAMEFFEAHLK
jgi:hypothetical protein